MLPSHICVRHINCFIVIMHTYSSLHYIFGYFYSFMPQKHNVCKMATSYLCSAFYFLIVYDLLYFEWTSYVMTIVKERNVFILFIHWERICWHGHLYYFKKIWKDFTSNLKDFYELFYLLSPCNPPFFFFWTYTILEVKLTCRVLWI